MENVHYHFQREAGLAIVSYWVDRAAPAHEEPCHPPPGGEKWLLKAQLHAAGFPGSGALWQKGFPPAEKLPGHPAQAQVPMPCMAICVAEEGWQRPCVMGAAENLSWKKVLFESLP